VLGVTDAFREAVTLVDPDPRWASLYVAEASRIERALADSGPVVEHIGSTAVPLRAKPIIDIQVAVPERDVPSVIEALAGLGYEHHGDGGVPGRAYLTTRPVEDPAFNVHVFAAGNPLLNDNRMIRDYLRDHPDAAREYEQVKARALEQGHTDLRSYSHAKGGHVAAIREAAYEWTLRGGRRPWWLDR